MKNESYWSRIWKNGHEFTSNGSRNSRIWTLLSYEPGTAKERGHIYENILAGECVGW